MESMPASFSRSSVFASAELRALGEIADLDHGERLQMHLRKALLQAAQHLAVPIERQFGMQAADDVKFGDGFAVAVAGASPTPARATWCRPSDPWRACRTRTAGNWRRTRRWD